MFRCVNTSPGCRPRRVVSGTRESEQPSQTAGGLSVSEIVSLVRLYLGDEAWGLGKRGGEGNWEKRGGGGWKGRHTNARTLPLRKLWKESRILMSLVVRPCIVRFQRILEVICFILISLRTLNYRIRNSSEGTSGKLDSPCCEPIVFYVVSQSKIANCKCRSLGM